MNELHISIGNGKLTSISVVNSYTNNSRTKEEIILDKVTKGDNKKITVKHDIIVEGIDEIKVNIASCCKPIPKDEIVGYISKGNGINVHRTNCPNISDLEERIIDVSWNPEISKKYSTDILIRASENKDLLLAIISKTSGSDISIQSINTIQSSGNYMFTLNVLVSNTEYLEKFMNDLRTISSIIQVERVIH